ncbi:MAG: aminoacyl-tRNA hydrolase [Spirochaetes bacterium RBG_13_51_14]|nr:MAG: aminoacyl-tRNA hydrolase [Spirochaetes bacterium RBG_13_51_14]
MFVVACLGNPGKKYLRNRHNIGYMLGSYLAEQYRIPLGSSPFKADSGRGRIQEREVLLLLPQTYMNNSGGPVRKAMDFYRMPPERLVAVHDDIELPFGQYRRKFGGGHKGQNGIRSIMQEIGTPDFHRIRFGVGRPETQEKGVADHVLSNFTDDELARIQELLPAVTGMLISIISGE